MVKNAKVKRNNDGVLVNVPNVGVLLRWCFPRWIIQKRLAHYLLLYVCMFYTEITYFYLRVTRK